MRTVWILVLFGSLIIHHCFTNASGEGIPSDEPRPSYSQCKPYVDAALKGDIPLEETTPENIDSSKTSTDTTKSVPEAAEDDDDSDEDEGHEPTTKITEDDDDSSEEEAGVKTQDDDDDSSEEETAKPAAASDGEDTDEDDDSQEEVKKTPEVDQDDDDDDDSKETGPGKEVDDDSEEEEIKKPSEKAKGKEEEEGDSSEESQDKDDTGEAGDNSEEQEEKPAGRPDSVAYKVDKSKSDSKREKQVEKTQAAKASTKPPTVKDESDEDDESSEEVEEPPKKSKKPAVAKSDKKSESTKSRLEEDDESDEDDDDSDKKVEKKKTKKPSKGKKIDEEDDDDDSEEKEIKEKKKVKPPKAQTKEESDEDDDESDEVEKAAKSKGKPAVQKKQPAVVAAKVDDDDESDEDESDEDDDEDSSEEDEEESYIPRSRDHLIRILGLEDSVKVKGINALQDKATQATLKELKGIYENAIKPLETMYKYRDLSNRHYGDPEIFSKPMVVLMGPWSGGKSTIINWLLGIQNEEHALRTGADPSPAQFNIMIHGDEEEILDGTQLAADWTFSGLQKFGQSFLDRLRGRKLPNRLLEKVNLVEIPGILEIRKQVERSFPFNDACQWFIDRADVLFLIYDPAKLDIGPETEAILDQLKGRENQVRIILNKADSVKPDELLRVQATLVWNISPLMASAEPPILYAASLWDHPLQPDSPTALLRAHENHFLKDINDANEKRVETRIAAARRFAVRVRNHAKMVDCYLNTYNNHRSFFSNKKKISDDIIEHPQNYHIYEGLSTLTNISRYDLPDPDSYRDFFRLNPLWDFPTLSSTCTYFRGCPINKLDIAIAYDLPELLGRYRRQRESIQSASGGATITPTPTPTPAGQKPVPQKPEKQKPPTKAEEAKRKAEVAQQKADEEEVKNWNRWWKNGVPQPVSYFDVYSPAPKADNNKPQKNKWWKDGVPQNQPSSTKSKDKDDGAPKKNKWWKDGIPQNQPSASKSTKDNEQQADPKKNRWWKEGVPQT